MINKDTEKLLSQEKRQSNNDLFYIESIWHKLSYWQRKKLGLLMRYYTLRGYVQKRREHVRSVIVSACSRAWVIGRGRDDTKLLENYSTGKLNSTLKKLPRSDVMRVLYLARFYVFRHAIRKAREHVRSVIVSASYRAGMDAACVCDLLSFSGMSVIYSLLALRVLFGA